MVVVLTRFNCCWILLEIESLYNYGNMKRRKPVLIFSDLDKITYDDVCNKPTNVPSHHNLIINMKQSCDGEFYQKVC